MAVLLEVLGASRQWYQSRPEEAGQRIENHAAHGQPDYETASWTAVATGRTASTAITITVNLKISWLMFVSAPQAKQPEPEARDMHNAARSPAVSASTRFRICSSRSCSSGSTSYEQTWHCKYFWYTYR